MTHCKLHIPIAALVLPLLAACSSDDVPAVPADGTDKSPIEFSMSGTGASVGLDSRGASAASRAGFGASTRIVMRIGSQKSGRADDKYTRTTATASEQVTTGTKDYSTVTFVTGKMRYWDDADGRDSHLSVYAVAVPDKNDEGILPDTQLGNYTPSNTWELEDATTEASHNTIKWQLSTDQSGKVANEDLCFSNNIQTGGKNGVYRYDFTAGKYPDFPGCNADGTIIEKSPRTDGLIDGVMKYYTESGYSGGKFDLGHLIFRHALTRITVKLIAGEGFEGKPFEFSATDGSNVNLSNMPISGTLDVTTGKWEPTSITKDNITNMDAATIESDERHSLVANMLPGREISKTGTDYIITFTIDDNFYRISEQSLYEALEGKRGVTSDGSKITLEQGKNYELRIKVSKQRINNITANIVDWVKVTADEQNPSNAYITLSLSDPSGNACNDFDFYRCNDPYSTPQTEDPADKHYNWLTGYDGPATLTALKSDKTPAIGTDPIDHYTTNWFFESNKDFYHFRTVNHSTVITTDATGGDFFAINSTTDNGYDPHWGAPMKSSPTLKYDPDKGYASSIYWAIGATKDRIKITEMHMMAQVNVILKTGTGSDKVILKDDSDNTATVKLVRYFSNGKVLLGNGQVQTTGTTTSTYFKVPSTYFTTDNEVTDKYFYNVVPQALSRGSAVDEHVGIEITTPDGNVYKVNDLTTIKASSVDASQKDQTVNEAITRWFPGHIYTYSFYLSKTEITDITATITNWIEVTTPDTPIQIE